ncbi:MAG: DUF488 domain-containing protein [Gaiellales bacterium]|nr:DUF488 domain-containing protein [Gaiellales bacterium]
MSNPKTPTVYTVGHSTRPLDDFVALLRGFGVQRVVDVRTIPHSRHNPQFDRRTLATALRNRRFSYRHLRGLGGLRHARADSPNLGWRNLSFRGFADYMQTQAFAEALEALIALAEERPTVIMCAEAVPWRCHRYLIADALLVRGLPVAHLMAPGVARAHSLHPLAVVHEGLITYPAPPNEEPAGAISPRHPSR